MVCESTLSVEVTLDFVVTGQKGGREDLFVILYQRLSVSTWFSIFSCKMPRRGFLHLVALVAGIVKCSSVAQTDLSLTTVFI